MREPEHSLLKRKRLKNKRDNIVYDFDSTIVSRRVQPVDIIPRNLTERVLIL